MFIHHSVLIFHKFGTELDSDFNSTALVNQPLTEMK